MLRLRTEKLPLEVTLPDGTRVTLDRPWHEYSIEDLAALGITPGMGGADVIAVIGRDERP